MAKPAPTQEFLTLPRRLSALVRAAVSRTSTPAFYAPSTRPKKTIADATPVKTHTGSKPLPNGRSKLNPSASAATETTPLKITGQFNLPGFYSPQF